MSGYKFNKVSLLASKFDLNAVPEVLYYNPTA
jgi:hypothetical protein